MTKYFVTLLVILLITLTSINCSNVPKEKDELNIKLNSAAEKYVKIILGIGNYDPDYVDAYYGSNALRDSVALAKPSLDTLDKNIDDLLTQLESYSKVEGTKLSLSRLSFLYKQLLAAKAKVFIIKGGKLPFNKEASALYDVELKANSSSYYADILKQISELLPGPGSLASRYEKFRNNFIIPEQKLDAVFKAAISECRKRTLEHIKLPDNEKFVIEYVKDKPWAGYNWYKGNNFSLIQVNTSLPFYVDRVIDIAAHEGYPGHHVYNSLLEQNLVKGKGWVEFTIYPLFSPQSLIAEGTANYGIEVAFTHEERMKFEKSVIFPLAGLDSSKADLYYKVESLIGELSYAGNDYAQQYLDGTITKEKAVSLYVNNQFMTKEKAEQRMSFIDKYRSYIINYNVGQDLVKKFVEHNGGTDKNPQLRWKLFEELLSKPVTPGSLKVK
ncbi:MAG: hypothetical protein Q8903_06260 [Bacteroidota bacterium]|nr:hypothetical protein [Bacteroidota bacterium]